MDKKPARKSGKVKQGLLIVLSVAAVASIVTSVYADKVYHDAKQAVQSVYVPATKHKVLRKKKKRSIIRTKCTDLQKLDFWSNFWGSVH